jgi:hypothetical protein
MHLTLNPVIEPGDTPDDATVRSILMIVDPAAPITIGVAVTITQAVRRTSSGWRIARRTVGPP